MKKTSILLLLLCLNKILNAQNAAIEAPTTNGMNVVITVIAVIFIGIIFYLYMLDKKISKLEKTINE